MLDRAIQVAARAHEGQTDKQGQPYLLHPIAVMMRVEPIEAKIVAVLHDVVEDTAVTLDELIAADFPDNVIAALRLVTHAKDEPYADYVVRAKANPIARTVKLADLAENTRIERALMRPGSLDRDARRLQRYVLSYCFLTDQIPEHAYREAMRGLE
jgi:(p)ppGpp synthase/HD superfamily hydrolase